MSDRQIQTRGKTCENQSHGKKSAFNKAPSPMRFVPPQRDAARGTLRSRRGYSQAHRPDVLRGDELYLRRGPDASLAPGAANANR